jgi:hypothetical protein
MQQPLPPSPSGAAATGGVWAEEDPFYDIVIPPEYLLPGLHDDDGADVCAYGAAAAQEDERRRLAEAAPADGDGGDGGGWEEQRLSMTYQGKEYVFDSVPPHKVRSVRVVGCGFLGRARN